MTPEQETALLAATTAGLDAELRDAFQTLLQLLRDGVPPRDAVQQVVESFAGEMAGTMSMAFSAILTTAMGSDAVMALEIGTVSLSARLYSESRSVSDVVQGTVTRHVAGFQDARTLALQLFEGYGFRDPAAEPLQFNTRNDALPKYMREALMTDPSLQREMAGAFARLQVDGLSTDSLRAAYRQALDAIDGAEVGAGRVLLEKRLEVAFFERMRYFATRIAVTELHRAYAQRQAFELLADTDVQFVQWRLSQTHSIDDICDFLAQSDRYGLGPGVYPKRAAPVAPAHPHCRCVLAPRLDLTGRTAREIPGADLAYFRTLDLRTAASVAGSRYRLSEILSGADPVAVHNAGVPVPYRLQTVEQVAG